MKKPIKFISVILSILVVAIALTIGVKYAYPYINENYLQDATIKIAASNPYPADCIKIMDAKWDGQKFKTTYYLCKDVIKDISNAQTLAWAAQKVASVTNLFDFSNIYKGLKVGKYSKTIDVVKDYLNIDEITKLNPAAVATLVLGWATDAFANAVENNCMATAVNSATKDKNGGVTIYSYRQYLTEASWIYGGNYLYSQDEWSPGSSGAKKSCTEKKVCIQFVYNDGTNDDCGWLSL